MGTRDDRRGPDVGEPSLRQRLIGPQPCLVAPGDHFRVICCLVERRYGPAKVAWGKADADYVTVDNQIKRFKAQVGNGLKPFEKDARAAIPAVICCGHEEHESDAGSARPR